MRRMIICWTPIIISIMNWLTKLYLYIMLIGLAVSSALFSCEDPSRLGIDLIGDNDDLGVLITEIALDTKVVQLDSINTTGKGILITGDHTDGDFGQVKVQSYLRILPPTANSSVPEEVMEADSVKMNLRYSYFFGSGFPINHQLAVHQLSEKLDPDSVYYSFNSTPFETGSVADTSFMVSESDTLLSLNLNGMKDELFLTLKNYQADSTNAANFLEQFKGLTLISGPPSNAALGFNTTHTESNILLYYTTNDTITNTIELDYSTYYNQITSSYAGTELNGIELLTDFTPISGKTYLQVGTGLVPKADFQPYFDFLDNDTTGTIVINKAELVVDNLQGLSGTIVPPQQMAFYFTNAANEIKEVGEEILLPATIQTDAIYITATRNNLDPFTSNVRSVQARLDTANVEYKPEITLFLQLVADGAISRNDINSFFSIPFSFVELPTSVRDNGRNLDRFIVEPQTLRLKLFYTRLR